MGVFLTRRFFSMILVWVGVTILTFLIANVVPSDPVALRLGPKATPESVAFWRHEYGLDLPLPQQYINYLGGLLRGDLGESIWSGRAVIKDLADYLPATLELALIALIFTIGLGIPLGVLSAGWAGGVGDRLIQTFATVGLALPLFWLGLVLQLFFYRDWGVLPLDSRIDLVLGPPAKVTGLYILDSLIKGDWQRFGDSLKHMLLPAVTLSLPLLSGVARMMRASMLETRSQEYIRTAYAKGGTVRYVTWKHIFRNALLPVTTTLGNMVNTLLAGVFVVEVIFNWPGLGWYATRVILASDYLAVVSITLVIAILSTSVNLLVDILYSQLDPRIQYS